jgi:hypothetical protein
VGSKLQGDSRFSDRSRTGNYHQNLVFPLQSHGAKYDFPPFNLPIFDLTCRIILTTVMIKYTTQFQLKLEEMIAESDYTLRYEKGNFKSGYCVLKDQKIMIINKFYTTEGKA